MPRVEDNKATGCSLTLPISWISAVILLVVTVGCHGPQKAERQFSDEDRAKYVVSFDRVFETIRDTLWDEELSGGFWTRKAEELRPRIETAGSRSEALQVLKDLLGSLELSHFGILPREYYSSFEVPSSSTEEEGGPSTESAGRKGDSGLDLRAIDGNAVIFRIEKEGAADAAGLASGWIIQSVDGESLSEVIEKVGQSLGDSSEIDMVVTRVIEERFTGNPGDHLEIVARDGGGEIHDVDLVLGAPAGTRVTFGHLPPIDVEYESRWIGGEIGYLRLSSFFAPTEVMPWFKIQIEEFNDARGIILDLRGNPGGIGLMACGIAGWFIEDEGHNLGKMKTRAGEINFFINPRLGAFGGPFALLVDGGSASTSEILAGGLQDLGRARIFGSRTAGAALPSTIDLLPSGDGFQYAIANYFSASGRVLEGAGVVPDEVIELDRGTLVEGRDPVVEAAVRWITGAN